MKYINTDYGIRIDAIQYNGANLKECEAFKNKYAPIGYCDPFTSITYQHIVIGDYLVHTNSIDLLIIGTKTFSQSFIKVDLLTLLKELDKQLENISHQAIYSPRKINRIVAKIETTLLNENICNSVIQKELPNYYEFKNNGVGNTMFIVSGDRGSGRTYELIKLSSKYGYHIIAEKRGQVELINKQAVEMNLTIPEVILLSPDRRGRDEMRRGVLLDFDMIDLAEEDRYILPYVKGYVTEKIIGLIDEGEHR